MNAQPLLVYRHLEDTAPYVQALRLAGLDPVLGEAKHGTSLGECAGLLLMGGDDVNPSLYGEAPLPETEAPDDLRDTMESALIDEALVRDLPVFAICRGMQILNVHLGGSLVQHLDSTHRHRRRTPNRGLPAHAVQIEPGTLLSDIAGSLTLQVNSRHHQAVARLGKGLRVNARDDEDGTIEGVELPHHSFVLAVQWHPENQAPSDSLQRKLFEQFAAAINHRYSTLNVRAR